MSRPDPDRLYEIAVAQAGCFTTRQAAEAGYSRPLLDHHVRGERFHRLRRGIYRLVHFPSGEDEDLVVAWLWSDRQVVASHGTALALHGLSDALPARIHLTVPASWARRRLTVPSGYVLHFADVPDAARAWAGAVPVTTPLGTVLDCRGGAVSPNLVAQAIRQGLARGLFGRDDLAREGVEP